MATLFRKANTKLESRISIGIGIGIKLDFGIMMSWRCQASKQLQLHGNPLNLMGHEKAIRQLHRARKLYEQ